MSEMINNREHRQKILKELIKELHSGKSVEEVQPRFAELIKGISTKEITDMEQALIMEGMPVAEIQNLCDVHAAVFKGSIEEIHRPQNPEEIEGHPVYTLRMENRRIEEFLDGMLARHFVNLKETNQIEDSDQLHKDFLTLLEIDKHYSKKENLLFPYLEQYGVTAPPKVMWGVDDEIREEIKEVLKALKYPEVNNEEENNKEEDNKEENNKEENNKEENNKEVNNEEILEKAEAVISRIKEMIFKEESILLPMAMDMLSEEEWGNIAKESGEIGYTFIEPRVIWKPRNTTPGNTTEINQDVDLSHTDHIKFDAGYLSTEEVNAMLNTLPLDITFVDKEGKVNYFTQGKERIFPRPKSVIGREVSNCHPPASVHIVEQIVEDLKSGKKDHEDFWIKMKGQYVYIRYYAVRNSEGEYLGVMEVTQNIQPIQELSGEKRLVSEH